MQSKKPILINIDFEDYLAIKHNNVNLSELVRTFVKNYVRHIGPEAAELIDIEAKLKILREEREELARKIFGLEILEEEKKDKIKESQNFENMLKSLKPEEKEELQKAAELLKNSPQYIEGRYNLFCNKYRRIDDGMYDKLLIHFQNTHGDIHE